MRRASSLVGLPDDPVGLMADAGVGVLPIHRRSGSRSSRAMGARDPKDRRRRRTSTARRRLVALAALALAALVLRAVAYLASWYPGDETIRASSESFLRLMFSRSGVSFGKTKSFAFSKEVTIDAGDSIKLTQKAAVVQGEISRRPRWRAGEDVNVTRHAELEWNADEKKSCFFRVHADAPAITFFDDGVTRVWRLRGLDELQLVRAAKGKADFGNPVKTHGHKSEEGEGNDFGVDDLRCVYFRAASSDAWSRFRQSGRLPASLKTDASPVRPDPLSDDTLLLINSATTLSMLSEYHRPLLNHQAYAESNGYKYVLALVKPFLLAGRSGKFAKHLALGAHLAAALESDRQLKLFGSSNDSDSDSDSDSLERDDSFAFSAACHVDLDAWFASWAPFGLYGAAWEKNKDVLFGDAGQIWLNTGLLCARPTEWAVTFEERVVNAVFSNADVLQDVVGVREERETGKALALTKSHSSVWSYGFQRDQPAVWHVLATTWRLEAGVPYEAQGCGAWHRACNPVENPIECWHWCHWDALQRWRGWRGTLAEAVNALPRVALAPRHAAPSRDAFAFFGDSFGAEDASDTPPPMHRMCLRSCASVLRRFFMGVCGALTGGSARCFPADVDKMSLCDGAGCLAQMASGGGAGSSTRGTSTGGTRCLRACRSRGKSLWRGRERVRIDDQA